jgi:hypothetical protein
MFDGSVPGSYSHSKPEYTYGTIKERAKHGVLRVLWDGDSRPVASHWKHIKHADPNHVVGNIPALLFDLKRKCADIHERGFFCAIARAQGVNPISEPYKTLTYVEEQANIEHLTCLQAAVTAKDANLPRSFVECLLDKNWRGWLEAVRKEHSSWIEKNVAEEVPRSERDPSEALVRIGELYTIKRGGKMKFRPYVMGNHLRPNIDFHSTFSGTVTADSIRLFFSLATALGAIVKGGDVTTAYLCGTQQIKIFCYKPSYWPFVNMSVEELMKTRKFLLQLFEKGGKSAVKKFANQHNWNDSVLRIKRPVYGIPSAGSEWGLFLTHCMVRKMGFTRSCVDGAVYFKTSRPLREEHGPFRSGMTRKVSPIGEANHATGHRLDSQWCKEYLMVLTWTDDMPYFGTPKMLRWYEQEAPKHFPIKFEDTCEDFVSIEINRDEKYGLYTLTHSKYILAMGEKYKDVLGTRKCKVPMKPSVEVVLRKLEPTEEQHEAVKDFPYRQLTGLIAFPTCHTKLEARYAISVISRFLNDRWTQECVDALLDLLAYMLWSHDVGIMYSRGLDQHGTNTLYSFADSAFSEPRSQGARMVKMNGAMISFSSKRHTTTDTSTTSAELTEAFQASNDVCGFRNMMSELGFNVDAPTRIWQDCMPAIQVAEGERNMTANTRHMSLRIWKIRERLDMQQIELAWCSTRDQQADFGTKSLLTRPFVYLRDNANGYALVRLFYPERPMPAAVISYAELIQTLDEFDKIDRNKKGK